MNFRTDTQKRNIRFRHDLNLSEKTCNYLETQYIFTIDDYCQQVHAPICAGMMESFSWRKEENEEIEKAFEEHGLTDFVQNLRKHYEEESFSREEVMNMHVGYLDLGVNTQIGLLRSNIRTVGDCFALSEGEWLRLRNLGRGNIEDVKKALQGIE